MGNIITYVQQYGHLGFDEMGFNEVDSLILAQMAYLDYSCCMGRPERFGTALRELTQMGFRADCPANHVSADRCRQLFGALAASRRFGGVGVDRYADEIDTREEKQFSAVTFRLTPDLYYIAYRGTDSTVVGWKEDLNMSYLQDVPAQRAALAYFEDIAGELRGHYILGGHSKGGNLAVYAAANADEDIQSRIALIYDHDGPGFLEEVLRRPGFARVSGRIYKSVPQSAVVGLLLAEHEEYTVVDSDAVALLQHDPFSWKVEDARFVALPETDLFSRAADRTLKAWLSETDDATRKHFVDTLFGIIGATGAHTLPELTEDLAKNALSVAMAVRETDPTVRRMMLATLHSLLRASGKGVRDTLDDAWLRARESLDGQLSEFRSEFLERFRGLNPPDGDPKK